MLSGFNTQKQKSISSFVQSIDDQSIRTIMKYFRIEDYDCFVNFARSSGSSVKLDNKVKPDE
jgi:hypothetical protein